jgi:hypothetical protein
MSCATEGFSAITKVLVMGLVISIHFRGLGSG